jgi:hypothetical protein
VCEGLVDADTGLPSPKFQEYTGVPVVVFVNDTANGAQPVVVAVEKFATGAGLIVTAIVVSSEQVAEEAVSTTLKVDAVE